MLIYSSEHFIKAHEDVNIPYKNHSYNRYVRECFCSHCNTVIGEQVKYPDFNQEYHFEDNKLKAWKFCPVCGYELRIEKD